MVTEEDSAQMVEPKDSNRLNKWVAKWWNIALESLMDPQQILHEEEIKLYEPLSLFYWFLSVQHNSAYPD